MPVTIKMNKMHLKKDDGTYMSMNTVAEQSTEEMIEGIQAAGEEVLASIPEDYQTVTGKMLVEIDKQTSGSTTPRDADVLGGRIKAEDVEKNATDITALNNNLAQLGKYEKNELVLVGKWGNKNLYRVNIDGDTGSKVNDWNVVYTAPTGKLIVRYELYMEIGTDYWTVNNIFDGVNFVYTAYRNNNTEIATCPSSSRINKQLYGVVWLCDN